MIIISKKSRNISNQLKNLKKVFEMKSIFFMLVKRFNQELYGGTFDNYYHDVI